MCHVQLLVLWFEQRQTVCPVLVSPLCHLGDTEAWQGMRPCSVGSLQGCNMFPYARCPVDQCLLFCWISASVGSFLMTTASVTW